MFCFASLAGLGRWLSAFFHPTLELTRPTSSTQAKEVTSAAIHLTRANANHNMFIFTSTREDAIQSLKYSVLLHSMLLCNLPTYFTYPIPSPPYSHPDHPDR
jgi:hypothetical protein